MNLLVVETLTSALNEDPLRRRRSRGKDNPPGGHAGISHVLDLSITWREGRRLPDSTPNHYLTGSAQVCTVFL
jgi:hypothetical protein